MLCTDRLDSDSLLVPQDKPAVLQMKLMRHRLFSNFVAS